MVSTLFTKIRRLHAGRLTLRAEVPYSERRKLPGHKGKLGARPDLSFRGTGRLHHGLTRANTIATNPKRRSILYSGTPPKRPSRNNQLLSVQFRPLAVADPQRNENAAPSAQATGFCVHGPLSRRFKHLIYLPPAGASGWRISRRIGYSPAGLKQWKVIC
jgi:hypothetical protein